MSTQTKKLKLKETSRKQKFIGYKELVDPSTGEVYPMQVNSVEERDFNFHKIWFQHFVNGIDSIANQKLRLAFWIIDNLNSENQLIMTQQGIAEKTGMCFQTVNRTIKALCGVDGENSVPFLQKMHSGAYRVNPDIIYKGSHRSRMGVCYQFFSKDQEHKKKKKIADKKWSVETGSMHLD